MTSLQTLSTQGIVLTQVIVIVAYLFIRFRVQIRAPILWQLLLIDGIVIVYYLGIYAMFLFSMPTEEALYLADFDRYASSIVILALGLAMMFLAREIDHSLYEQNVAKRNFKSYKNIQTKKCIKDRVSFYYLCLRYSFYLNLVGYSITMRNSMPQLQPNMQKLSQITWY